MANKVELIEHDIIYVEKVGDQTEESLQSLFDAISGLAKELRAHQKPVLILSNAEHEGSMDRSAIAVATKIGSELDYDKSATYGSTHHQRAARDTMIAMEGLARKVENFQTKEDALSWLLSWHGQN